jgi:hypothetical protein
MASNKMMTVVSSRNRNVIMTMASNKMMAVDSNISGILLLVAGLETRLL